jgi:hypothetical protein
VPDAQAIADEIAATHDESDGPDHPLAAGFDAEFALRFVNRAFTRAGHGMTMRDFLRVLNSSVFEVLVKGKETERRFFRLSCGPYVGWSFETSEGEIPRDDVWLLLRLHARPIDRVRARLRRPGAAMLSNRRLASELGVSRDTVARGRKRPDV